MPLQDKAFDGLRHENSIRLGELRAYWSTVKLTAKEPPDAQPFVFLAGTGLTLVYCYALMERCVNRAVEQLIELIDSFEVRVKDINYSLMCLVLDPQVKSVLNAGKANRVSYRLALFEAIQHKTSAKLESGFISADLQNIWAKSLENIFDVFGISDSPHVSARGRARINQLVDDRNAVAHGREAPEAVGAKYTIKDMDATIEWLGAATGHIIEMLEKYYFSKGFVTSSSRYRY